MAPGMDHGATTVTAGAHGAIIIGTTAITVAITGVLVGVEILAGVTTVVKAGVIILAAEVLILAMAMASTLVMAMDSALVMAMDLAGVAVIKAHDGETGLAGVNLVGGMNLNGIGLPIIMPHLSALPLSLRILNDQRLREHHPRINKYR